MKNKPPIHLCTFAGMHILTAIRKALKVASEKNRKVVINFNGFKLKVGKRMSAQHLKNQFDHMNAAASSRFSNSPEGRACAEMIARARQEERLLAEKLIYDELSFMDHDCTMVTLLALSNGMPSDKQLLDELIHRLETAGYQESQLVGHDKDFFDSREKIAQYVAGQAINCAKHGYGPHQITSFFHKEYLLKPVLDA